MIAANLQRLRDRVAEIAARSGRDPQAITLVAVSKTRSLAEVEAALCAGQKDFGENIIQDAMTKVPATLDSGARWHFIGHLQSKKCKHIPGCFHWLHSIDSERLVTRLDHAITAAGAAPLNGLIQVNLSGEASKSGLPAAEVEAFMERILRMELETIRWRGLMTIGVRDDSRATGRVFAACRELQRRLATGFGLDGFDQLSMGMSGDYAEAVREGATLLRIGTAIFGERAAP